MRTLAAIFLLSLGAFGQTTAVTATITDSDGQAWLNGTYQISFLPTYGVPGPYSWNGGQPFTQFFSGSMNGSGTLSVSLPSNNFISPALSKWVFQLCSNTSATCSSTAVSVTGANVNLSAVLSAAIPAPRFGPGPTAFGYSDIEVGTPAAPVFPGAFYWNVISQVQRVWNGVSWQNGGGNGASCAPPTPAITYFNGSITVCDPNASLDGNGNLSLTSVTASGTVTASTLATSGVGGILSLKFQTPPVSVPANTGYVFLNTNTGLLGCLNSSLASCVSGVQLIGSGAVALPTSAITSGACSSVVTLTATGATTSSHIVATAASDPTSVTGYGPSASGSLYVQAYVTANTANFKVCNNTASTITPGALTLNAVVF